MRQKAAWGGLQHPLPKRCTLRQSALRRCKVLNSLVLKVHRRDAVVVAAVPALPANKAVLLLVAVPGFNMATARTSLAGILRRDDDYLAAMQSCFVLHLAAKVIERPTDLRIAVIQPDFLCDRADAGKVFQDKQRSLRL